MRALVTGGGGFVGRWLVAHLEAAGDEVWSFDRSAGETSRHVRGDVRDAESIAAAVSLASPDAIYHLAGVAFGPDVRRNVGGAVHTTVGGTVNLLDAAAQLTDRPVVIVAGSAEVYAAKDAPLQESDQLAPSQPYGHTKLAQEAVSLAYHYAGAVDVAVTRAFNHIGPGQRTDFVVSAFASQLAAIAHGSADPVMRVGNLNAERDFTDVRDVVAAYRLVAQNRLVGQPLNVASGVGIRVGALLDMLLATAGLKVAVEVDPTRIRAGEAQRVVGDATRLRQSLGWSPSFRIEQTIADIWADALANRAGGATTGRAVR